MNQKAGARNRRSGRGGMLLDLVNDLTIELASALDATTNDETLPDAGYTIAILDRARLALLANGAPVSDLVDDLIQRYHHPVPPSSVSRH